MNLFPFASETLVIPQSKEKVLEKLLFATESIDYIDTRSQTGVTVVFHGKIKPSGFKISKIIQRANTFIPLLTGKIERTSSGSIIFIKYRLFPGALFFLVFWSVILVLFSGFCIGISGEIGYGIGCLGLAILNYLSTLLFFGRQLKVSRKLFFDIIELPLED